MGTVGISTGFGSERPSTAYSGFTIVELLVVIAVVSILAAILLPTYARARAQSYRTVCLSQERQIGQAILMYVEDNDEYFPNGVQHTTSGGIWQGEGWYGQCAAYLRAPAILACPADPTPASARNRPVSYGYNINFIVPGEGYEEPLTGRAHAAIGADSRSVLLFEVENVTADLDAPLEGSRDAALLGRNLSASANGLDNRLYAQTDASTSIENQYATGYLGGRRPFDASATQFEDPDGRHFGGSNFVMGDGHAVWMRGSQVSSGLDSPLSTCNQDDSPPIAGCYGRFQAAGTEAQEERFRATFSTQ